MAIEALQEKYSSWSSMAKKQMAYNKLSSEFYDLDPTYSPEKEVAFLSPLIEQGVPGPWLEAISGSARILVPLLQKGFVFEGSTEVKV